MVIMNVRYVLRHSKMIVFGHAVGTTTIIIDNIGYILIFLKNPLWKVTIDFV